MWAGTASEHLLPAYAYGLHGPSVNSNVALFRHAFYNT